MHIALAFVQLTHPKLFDIEQPPLQQQQNHAPKTKQWKATKHVHNFYSWFENSAKDSMSALVQCMPSASMSTEPKSCSHMPEKWHRQPNQDQML